MTGRGLNRVGAHAPGANATHIGICFMVSNTAEPTAAQLQGFREFRTWLSARGVNSNNITPHSRWISTSCPGNALRARISSNNWGGGGGSPTPPGGSSGGVWTIGQYRVPTGDPVLSRGDSGPLVKGLQQALLAWDSSLMPKWKADGTYGQEAVDAVTKFQKAYNLGVDGAYGTESAGKLRQVITDLEEGGVLGMTENRTFNDQSSEQSLPRGEWTEVRWEDGKYSLAFAGETFQANIALRVSGLEKGEELQYRFTQVQPNPDGSSPAYTRARHLGIDSPVHDGGQLHVTGSWGGKVPSKRRIRVEVTHFSDSEDVKITGRSASVLYSK